MKTLRGSEIIKKFSLWAQNTNFLTPVRATTRTSMGTVIWGGGCGAKLTKTQEIVLKTKQFNSCVWRLWCEINRNTRNDIENKAIQLQGCGAKATKNSQDGNPRWGQFLGCRDRRLEIRNWLRNDQRLFEGPQNVKK